MKKTENPAAAQVAEIKERLTAMTDEFCDTHLSAEYKRLCRKVIGKYGRDNAFPLLRGDIRLWAAGIVYALCSANYAFAKESRPHIRSEEISNAFGTNPRSTAQKAGQIRDRYEIGYQGDTVFLTKQTLAQEAQQEAKQEESLRNWAPKLLESLLEETEREPTSPTRDGGEFVDGDHPVMTRYYALLERYENSRTHPVLQAGLEELIRRDPDFYDPYLLLAEIHRGKNRNVVAAELLETAYQRALARILDENGEWPRALQWGWLENRHIIRTFLNKAIALWNAHKSAEALDIFRRLLRANPGDNAGVRDYILAIRLGLSFTQFEKKFASAFGYDGMELLDWFEANESKFPDEFGWWKEAVGYDQE